MDSHRITQTVRFRFGWLVAAALLLPPCGLAGGQTSSPEAGRTATPAQLLTLNRAIRAYAEDTPESRAVALAEFEKLRGSSYSVAASYHIGLLYLRQGLDYAQETAAAKQTFEVAEQELTMLSGGDEARRSELRQTMADASAAEIEAATQARALFIRARKEFQDIVRTIDPRVEPLKASLLLGIAQLAADIKEPEPDAADPESVQDEIFQLAVEAEETLVQYAETEVGVDDEFGHFYLAVSRYRLADEYRKRSMVAEERDLLGRAQEALDKAAAIAQRKHETGQIEEEDFVSFDTVVLYYTGLLHVARGDDPAARDALTQIRDPQRPGYREKLAYHAGIILDKLEEVAGGARAPKLRLPVPEPFGPLEFDGRIIIGNRYDTNVILLGEDTLLPLSLPRDDDYAAYTQAEFNISRYFPSSEMQSRGWFGEDLLIGMGGTTAQVWQANIHEFDLNQYSGRAYVNWQPWKDWYFGLQYEYAYTMLGNEAFIGSHRISPTASKLWRDGGGDVRSRTDLFYTLDLREYFDPEDDFRLNRDGNYHALGLTQTFNVVRAKDYLAAYYETHEKEREFFANDWLRVYLGYLLRSERTDGTEFDMLANTILWGLRVPLPYRFTFGLDGEFTWEDYNHRSIFDYFGKERFDFVQRYDFSLTHTFVAQGEMHDERWRTLEIKLRMGIELTFQNSNVFDRLGQDIYQYDRANYGVELQVAF